MKACIRLAAVLPLALALAIGYAPGEANAQSATLQVRATIRPYLQFSAVQSVGSYQVTAAEIRRGHIDLPRALTLQYRTNIPETIAFDIASAGPEQIQVAGTVGSVQVAEPRPGQSVSRDIDLRILLPPQMEEGVYPLQIALAPVAY